MIRAFASGTGGIGLDPGPRDTKNVKNGTQKYLASLALIIHKASTGISSPKKITSVISSMRNSLKVITSVTIIEVVVGDGQFSSVIR